MKLQKTKGNKAETLNVTNKKEFTVDTSNQMIVSILRDKLYSNKVAAVCREVASNSRDANREAGRGDTPVLITISETSILNDGMSISFKDSGIGISPSRIDNVFLKYGSSTKRDSNSQTGGFGIGAKTPFAYTNEFVISTVSEENGKRLHTVYQALISNENGQETSQLLTVSSNETTEETGTEIIVPIQEVHLNEFIEECRKATMLWDVQPKIMYNDNNVSTEIHNLIKEEDFKVIYGKYNSGIFDEHQDGLFLQVDGIPYSINDSQIGRVSHTAKTNLVESHTSQMYTRYYYENTGRNTVLIFNTGELTMSASREAIEYTEDNVEKIMAKLQTAEDHIKKLIIDDFNSQKTILDKITTFNSYSEGEGSAEWINKSDDLKLKNYFKKFGARDVIKEAHPDYANYGTIKKISDNAIDFYKIKKHDRFSFSKKNKINGIRPCTDFIQNNLFVMKRAGESNAYAKNLTLQTMMENKDKDAVVFLTGISFYETEGKKWSNPFTDMLKEAGVNVIQYADVERTKVERTYSGGGSTKPKNLGTLYGRYIQGTSSFGYRPFSISKLKMEYDKVENVITDFDFTNEDNNKVVFIPCGIYAELKDLDKKNYSVESAIQKTNINHYEVMTQETQSDGSVEEVSCRPSYNQAIYLLCKYNYKVAMVKGEDLHKFENDKSIIVGLNKAFKDLTKNKEFRKDLVSKNRQEIINDVNQFYKGSHYHDKYCKSQFYKDVIMLGGLDISKQKTPVNEVTTMKDRSNLYAGACLNELSKKFSKTIKGRDYTNYLTMDKIDSAIEKVKTNHPLIHYLYEQVDTTSNWSFSEYDKYDKTGDNVIQKGLEMMRGKVHNMVKVELDKK